MRNIFLALTLVFTTTTLLAQGDLHIFDVNNKMGKISSKTIEEVFKKNGFTIGVRSEMNGPFKKQFKQTDFKSYTLLTVFHTKLTQALVRKYPDAGVFAPMGVGIWQKLNDNTLHVSILSSSTQAKILGIKDKSILLSIEKDMLKVLKIALPNSKHSMSKKPLGESRKLITKYELELDKDNDPDEVLEELEMTLDAGFDPRGFIVAGFSYYNDVLNPKESDKSVFNFYKTYSICKLEVIYTVAKIRPEASAFAPCTTMIYKKRDENKVVMGFPSVYNWMSSAIVDDKNSQKVLQKAQNDFEDILKEIVE
jgi:uncharacterized protein (DUF302 family)